MRLMNASNVNSSHSPTKFSRPAHLTTYTILSLFSLHVEPAPHLLSVTLARPSISSLQITNHSNQDMHHLTFGINSLLPSVNLIRFTLLLVHLILCISPHHSQHLHSHHLSLPLPSTPDLKLIYFTNNNLRLHPYTPP